MTLFFSHFSALKPNLAKFEIAGIEVQKEVQVVICGMCCIDLNIDSLKILGTHFPYNEKSEESNFLKHCDRYSSIVETMEHEKAHTKRKVVIF